MTSLDLEATFERNRRWASERIGEDPTFFSRLAEGQQPSTLYIGCSDSRVTAEELMGVGPGDVFVVRNLGNMASALDVGALTVVEYAVVNLGVSDIVVCGHYLCGAVEAAMVPRDAGMLNLWLRTLRDVYRLHSEELDGIADRPARHRRLVELNVREQCINVLKAASVQRAYRAGRLRIHGWVFDISRGLLADLAIDVPREVERIAEIYRLDPD